MLRWVAEITGPFFYPQLALSVAVVALVAGYALAGVRGEFRRRCDQPWRRTLDPLAGFAVSLGLLGSVWSFTVAFGGFQNGIDVEAVTAGLGTAYATTAVGLVTSLVAGVGSYLLGLAHRERHPTTTTTTVASPLPVGASASAANPTPARPARRSPKRKA